MLRRIRLNEICTLEIMLPLGKFARSVVLFGAEIILLFDFFSPFLFKILIWNKKSLVKYVPLVILVLIIGIFWLVSRGLVINRDCTIVLDREQAKMHTQYSLRFSIISEIIVACFAILFWFLISRSRLQENFQNSTRIESPILNGLF